MLETLDTLLSILLMIQMVIAIYIGACDMIK